MNFKAVHALLLISTTLALVACSEKRPEPAPTEVISETSPAHPVPDHWLGQWNGPEGTFLRLDKESVTYKVTIQNLDGPRSFAGTPANGTVQFERDGVQESIHAGNGADTGMKWLSDKSNCLVVRSGEGYCRD